MGKTDSLGKSQSKRAFIFGVSMRVIVIVFRLVMMLVRGYSLMIKVYINYCNGILKMNLGLLQYISIPNKFLYCYSWACSSLGKDKPFPFILLSRNTHLERYCKNVHSMNISSGHNYYD